ncbi:hypothetical protein HNQ91_003801 [Filimonas zeae]|nr:hypothetical protein [Filimonas zeae]
MQTTFTQLLYADKFIYAATIHVALYFPEKHITDLLSVTQA